MNATLKRIKRCVIAGRVRFTYKARLEMIADELTESAVLEAILSAPAIDKRIRSRSLTKTPRKEYLYIIRGMSFDKEWVYTKGKLHREEREDFYYILISAKADRPND
jgi:hypothetical protein